jgi:hypothetical protein
MSAAAETPCSFYVQIPHWTGLIINQSTSTFALGNDVMQIAEALIDVYRTPEACGVDFCKADGDRGRRSPGNKTNGFTASIPSLASGRIQVRRPGNATLHSARNMFYGLRYGFLPPHLSLTLAAMNTALYEKLLRTHLWPHLQQFAEYRGPPLDHTLVVYLRSDDARSRMNLWFPEWKPRHLAPNCSLFEQCIAHSAQKHVVVVTRVANSPEEHPMLQQLRETYGDRLRIQSGSLAEDFATLVHARHLCLDFSTIGMVATLLNPHLRSVYLPRLFGTHDVDAYDDFGWTVPATAQRAVFVVQPSPPRTTCLSPIAKPISKMMDEPIEALASRADCATRVAMFNAAKDGKGNSTKSTQNTVNINDACRVVKGLKASPSWSSSSTAATDDRCTV